MPDIQPAPRPRITVVDDNPDNRLLLEILLEDRYAVSQCEDGLEAMRLFADGAPDLVLLDISLPGMDGMEVIRALRALAGFERLPVVALTAHAMPGDEQRFLEAGFTDYVKKPIVDASAFLATVERLLAS